MIITPQGRQIERIQGPAVAREYVERLNQIAALAKRRDAGTYAQIPAGPPPIDPSATRPPPSGAPRQPSAMPRYSDAHDGKPGNPVTASPPAPVGPRNDDSGLAAGGVSRPYAASQRSTGQLPPGNPPLGLDGYCPVQLADRKEAWTSGDRRWGAIHRGRTYLFAGPDQQRRFLTDPDRYAPVLSGNDVVAAVERNRIVAGHRKHGLFFGDRIFLFADEPSLAQFSKNPDYYASRALAVMRADVNRGFGAAAQAHQRRY